MNIRSFKMKTLKILITLLMPVFAGQVSSANGLNLSEVVLIKDVYETPAYYSFPCALYMDEVFCSSTLILENNCRATLEITDKELSCKPTSSQSRVVFGKYSEKDRLSTRSRDSGLAYRINYDLNRVSLRELTTPNGNREYQLIVK